jgi:class 3 adenylate cyclase/CheY-like chemotaxis protein
MTVDPKDEAERARRHALRTPLNQILGYSEMLHEDASARGDAASAGDLEKIQAAARRMLELVEALAPDAPESLGPSPVRAVPSPAALVFPEPSAPPAASAEEAPGHILVVDDNEMNRDMLSRRLSSRGYAVTIAGEGEAALRQLAVQRFDAVLLDVMMPGITGIEVLSRIRSAASESDLPVIMVTARDAAEDVVEALRLGANDYVTKPLDFPVVLARLRTQLTLKRQKDEIRRLAEGLEIRNRFIQQTFGRYLSDEIVSGLLESPKGLALGGEQRRVTILMADLRGFTWIAEKLTPDQVVRLLNSYLGAMADVILAHQGTIDEFIGDAILAVFGAPVRREDDARRAVGCAVGMQIALAGLNRRNQAEGLPRVEMGVAVHTGEVVVGNIGSEKRAKYGVVGSPVNHTGRIESFTVGGQVLISETTLAEAGPDVRVGERLSVDAKGARDPIAVYDLRGIGAPYDVSLPEREGAPVRLPYEIRARYYVLEDKRVGTEAFEASFAELSVQVGLMRSRRRLRTLSNLKIEFEGAPGTEAFLPELYAKVVDARGEGDETVYVVRFTSVPLDVERWIKGLLGVAPGRL